MSYEAKTNWKLDDTVMPEDMNRIEQGIQDLGLELGNVAVHVITASEENIVDFNALVETGIYIIKNATISNTLNGINSFSSNGRDLILFVMNLFGNTVSQLIFTKNRTHSREYNTVSLIWTDWGYSLSTQNINIPTTGWTSTNPYTISISNPNFYASDYNIVIIPNWDTDVTIRKAQQEAWNCVSMIETYDNGIKVTCDDEIPTTEIPIKVIVQR